MSKRAVQVYQIPEATIEEVANCLNEMDVKPPTLEEVNNPTPEIVMNTLFSVTERMLDLREEELIERNNELLLKDPPPAIRENPEPFEHALLFFEKFKKIQKLLMIARLHDFSLTDIIKPTPTRFKLALFGILNLAKFRETKIGLYNEIIGTYENLALEKEELQVRIKEDEEVLQQYIEQDKRDEAMVKTMSEKVKEMTDAIKEMNLKDLELKNDVQKVTAETETNEKKIELSKEQLENLNKENRVLRSQIVINPEELKRRITSLKKFIETSSKEIKGMEEELTKITVHEMNYVQRMIKALSKCNSILEQYEGLKVKKKELSKTLKSKQETIENIENDCSEMESARKQIQKQMIIIGEKMDKLQNQHYQRIEVAEGALQDVQREKNMQESKNKQYREQLENNTKKIEELRRRISMMTQQHYHEIIQMKNQFEIVEDAVQSYHNRMVNTQ
ncbi:hypothetical protein ABK040_003586 [Willaertia magna]